MSPIIHSLGIDRLSRDERLVLVQEIWESIAAEQPPAILSEAQRQELERRVQGDDANPNDVVPWDEVRSEALARLKKP
jgi:putative addiction module component (TIGR02574 family)